MMASTTTTTQTVVETPSSLTPLKYKGSLQQFDLTEVKKHNQEHDAWLIISGAVYNITDFIRLHPGGKSILLPYLGSNATEEFISDNIHSHSEKAFRLLDKYLIGSVDDFQLVGRKLVDDDLANLVDFKKAVLPQVIEMDPLKYQTWLHQATGSSKMRIFESDFFESLSRYPWWYIFPMWIPIIIYTTYLSYWNGCSLWSIILTFVCGVFGWGFVEYIIHRFLFHVQTASTAGNFYHLFAHGLHHLSPLDPTRLTFPPAFSVVVGTGLWWLFNSFQPSWPQVQALFGGLACGYMLYDACHFYFHHGEFWMRIPYLQWMKTRHLRHHYKNDNKNFGVTSPLFDVLFGTAD